MSLLVIKTEGFWPFSLMDLQTQHPPLTTMTTWMSLPELCFAPSQAPQPLDNCPNLTVGPDLPSVFLQFLFPFLPCHSQSTVIFDMSLIWSERKNGWKGGSVNNLWMLLPWNWSIMIPILVPLLCCSLPHHQGGLCIWAGWDKETTLSRKAIFSLEAWRRSCLVLPCLSPL